MKSETLKFITKSFAIIALMAASSVVTAQQYVFMYKDGTTCNFLSRNGSNIQNTTTFNASSCVWNKVSGYEHYTSGSYYLRPRTGTSTESLNLSTNSSYATWSAVSNGKLYDYNQTSYCLRFNGTDWENGNTNSNNVVVYQYSAEEALFNVSPISGDASITSTSGSYQYTSSATYRPNYVTLAGVNTFYLVDGVAQTTAPTSLNSGITYEWTLSDNMSGYATVSSTGSVTYSTLVPEASRAATLTCTATHTSGATKEATYTITFINPTILQEPVISYTMASNGLQVTLTHPTDGVTIYYTKDGSDPQTSTTRLIYSAPFNVENNTTVKAYVVKDSKTSPVASELIQMSSGIIGDAVIVYEYEDHNWSYYKGLDYTLEDGTTTYKNKYKYSLYSPDPRNVKITYNCGGVTGATAVKVSNSEPQNQFVYYETLEKFVIGFFTQHQTDGDYDGTPANPNNTAEQYPYTVISNPFSVRPATTSGGNKTYYGFAGWKIKDGGEYILNHKDGDVLALDEIIHFKKSELDNNYTSNCTSAEVVFEATWTQANVKTGTSNQSFDGGTYETNFIVASGNIASITQYSPCTISAFYPDGTAYDANSSTRTITGLTVSTSGSEPKNNTVKVEWIRHGNGTFNANGKNMILGRGITSSSTQGTIYCSNSDNPCVNIVKIESGNYSTMKPINTEISATNAVNTYITFGCDYDKSRADYYSTTTNAYNTKLQINSMVWSNMGQVHKSNGILYLRTLFKSGTFAGQYYTHRSSHTGQRFVTIEGGYFTGNITGGSETDETQPNARSFTVRAKGNFRVDGRIAGGSDHNPCSGDRCMIFTGGRVGGWICAGSNSANETGGVTTGETFIYIGGNAQANSRQFDADGTAMFNTSTGGVIYGSGCGINHNSTAGGVTKGSNIVLADDAYVERGIYGGGAMGRISEGSPAHIYILGGKVGKGTGIIKDGSDNLSVDNAGVFGGACNVGGGYSYIYMNGGIVESGVYGGSNINGTMDNNTNVKIVGGQVGYATANANVHGGGLGYQTRVLGSVNVTVGKSGATDGATIYGDVYGGSAEGKTNGDNARTTDAVTNVTLNAGTVNGNVYGGGLGTSTYAADVWGPVTVKVTGGEAQNIFGCNNTNGAPKNTVDVNMTGGLVHECVYGGGNAAAYTAPANKTLNVTISGGEVKKNVFGGGLGASAKVTGNTNVKVKGTSTKVDGNVYGGGSAADVDGSTNVTIGEE